MKKIGLLPVVFFAATLLFSACGEQHKTAEASRQLDAIVKKILGGERSASENVSARKIHLLDFDHDGVKDVIAFFTIEGQGGGNNYRFYMTVLRGNGEGFVKIGTLKVGAKGERQVDFDNVHIENGMIIVATSEYAADDPMCCPSRPVNAKFAVVNGHLRELAKTVGDRRPLVSQ